MKFPRMRFSVKRLMLVIAMTSIVLGLTVEIPRVWRRQRFCKERAELFTNCAISSRRHWQKAWAELERTERFFRKLHDLGSEPVPIASLAQPSGDPDVERLWFKRLVGYVKQTEGVQESEHSWGEHKVSPTAFVRWYSFLPEAQRDQVRKREAWTENYARMALAYRQAEARPWEPLPLETIKP